MTLSLSSTFHKTNLRKKAKISDVRSEKKEAVGAGHGLWLSRRSFGQLVVQTTIVGAAAAAAWSLGACRRRQSTAGVSLDSPAGNGGNDSSKAHIGAPADGSDDRGLEATDPRSLRTFNVLQLTTVAAVCERLLPRDGDPVSDPGAAGARDLGVPSYIDRMLAEPELSAQRDLVLQILPILDRQSRIRYRDKPFHEATSDEQDALLSAWQRGRGGDRRFFETLLTLTLEGALSDPRHGGNRDGKGFALVGFAPGLPGLPGQLLHGAGGHGHRHGR